MRVGGFLVLGLASGFVASSAEAQIPLPQLEDGPQLRLAGDDPLQDQLESLVKRVTPLIESRQEALVAARKRFIEIPEEDEPDPIGLRLVDALELELRQLEGARDSASDALVQLDADLSIAEPVSFARLVELATEAERLHRLTEQREARARRLASIGSAIPPTKTATTSALSARLADALARAQSAEADQTLAEALELRVNLRAAEKLLKEAKRQLVVSEAEVQEADAAVKAATEEQEAAAEAAEAARSELSTQLASNVRGELRTLRRQLAQTRVETLLRAERNAAARLALARVKLAAMSALAADKIPTYPQDLGPDALGADLSAIAEARLEAEARLSDVRSGLREEPSRAEGQLLAKIRDGLEEVVASLAEERRALETAQRLERLLVPDQPLFWRSPEDWARVLGLTVAVLAMVVVLLGRGMSLLHRFEHWLEARAKKRGSAATGSRLITLLLILYPVGVLLGAAALLVWPIWQLPITVEEGLGVLDRPIVYLDQQPISFLSLGKLILTIWLTVTLSKLVRQLLTERLFRRLSVDAGLSNSLSTFVHYCFLAVGLTIGLRFVGIGLSSFALIAGVLGIGIGFGLRNVTENFISGIIVLVERPIQVGDWISMDGDLEGQVRDIRARTTTLRTRDNVSIIIPNSDLVAKQVTNWSHGDLKVRLQVEVGVAYGSDTDLVRRTLLEVAGRHGRVLERPGPEAQFRGFGASSLDFSLLVWIDQQQLRFRIESDLRFAIDAAFRRKGIEIAFPQLDVHLRSIDVSAVEAVQRAISGPRDDDEEEERARPIPLPDAPSRRASRADD